MNAIAIIPARSGSKGLKDKNILPVNGKPLMAYSIEAAREAGLFDTVFLSTDSAAYAALGRTLGAEAPFLRSAALASDTSSSWDAVREALEGYAKLGKHFDKLMLLQPTSPLRTAEDIRAAFALMAQKNAKAIVSVCEAEHPPRFMKPLPPNGCLAGFVPDPDHVRRQAQATCYRINGAVYLLDADWFLQGGMRYDETCFALVMPQARSMDVDDRKDLIITEAIMKDINKNTRGGG